MITNNNHRQYLSVPMCQELAYAKQNILYVSSLVQRNKLTLCSIHLHVYSRGESDRLRNGFVSALYRVFLH